MKTIFSKQVVIPAAVFALAIAGAFTTHAMNQRSKSETPAQGYLRLNPQGTACTEQDDECQIENTGIVCTVDYNT